MKKQYSQKEISELVDKAVKRSCSPKDESYFRGMIQELIENNSIPVDILNFIPVKAGTAGKTRFDQIYDLCMSLVFPEYKPDTIKKLLGNDKIESKTKIWRVVIPEKFKLTHVLIRATSFQEAFSLGCDYICRISLRLYKKIPTDLTMRVIFMSEKALRRYLDVRWNNKMSKRNTVKLEGREYTPKQISGARLAALGHPKNPNHSVVRYAEIKDLRRIKKTNLMTRDSMVESESYRSLD